jgi:hypothetical protein
VYLPTWTPRLLARLLGFERAIVDRPKLVAALDADRRRAVAALPAAASKAQRELLVPLAFQPSLVQFHRQQTMTTANLNALADAAETNLDLGKPDQRALYQALIDAAHQAHKLQEQLREAATSTLGAAFTADSTAN